MRVVLYIAQEDWHSTGISRVIEFVFYVCYLQPDIHSVSEF
jgi:hypothetical protein